MAKKAAPKAAPAPVDKVPTPAPTKKYTVVGKNPNPPAQKPVDSRLQPERNVGPGSGLHQRIVAESGVHDFMFGGPAMGPKDNGTGNKAMGALPGGAQVRKNGEVVKFSGSEKSKPAFKDVEPNAIKLSQMVDNHRREVSSDQRDSGAPAKAWSSGGTKMIDSGMRDDTPTRYLNAPVRTWIDESIKIKKD